MPNPTLHIFFYFFPKQVGNLQHILMWTVLMSVIPTCIAFIFYKKIAIINEQWTIYKNYKLFCNDRLGNFLKVYANEPISSSSS